MSEQVLRYTHRLRPSKTAQSSLLAEWDLCRFVWNMCVGRSEELWQERCGAASGYDMGKELTDWRGRFDWLAAGSQNAQQSTVMKWHEARQAAFKVRGRGRPRFKARHRVLPSLPYTTRGFSIKGNRLILAGGISIPVVWHRELPSEPTSVVVSRDSVGSWWASFVVRCEVQEAPRADKKIGIDWGIKAIATTTDEQYDLLNSRHGKRNHLELARVQRKMSRRRRPKDQPQTAGYKRAKLHAAKVQRKIARQRKHDARVWAKRVVDNHKMIAVEDFKPKFMAKNRRLSRAAADASVGAAKRELVERAQRAGRDVRLVPPARTSMTCAECGMTKTKRLELSERIFRCDCGYVADRDRNAARVILAWAESNPPSVEDARHSKPALAASAV